ncbi:CDP-glycerol:glycerophosphate glycerophosphotransferase [Streptomyces sp. XM4193]|uniref:bifunctional glycosyltransferase/CDP-glycerol:glycerophosphate glycerophosphotransferase n=1 Tax=Streptomyces sp. XM4193 TaxID=2929782 RepID=UPI001FFB1E69|nr:CDP-glycerol:glycerophosphate glycerophosphotransferase [Streptomyces sp. XM4193]MCK1799151.1 CDP-glycerol:glycerophosphate glycerophosphotransferase [Streptomyces sp. XM4193]
MPRFSIIVPAHQVQAYLPECLESVLKQTCTDLELILVDDGSPPDCGELLAEYASHDSRVTVLRLPRHSGPGPARNAGLRYAEGDYVLFLDSDDALTPGALEAIADRLAATADPDVLLFDHSRIFWHGGNDRSEGPPLGPLTVQEPQVVRLRDRPALLRVAPLAWNKAYRREFLVEQGVRFPPGAYEGIPWTWHTLLTAEAVAVLDRVCVRHRLRRQGGVLGSSPRRHFDVFGQYDRVFALLDERPELARWKSVLYRRMTDHLAGLFLTPGRLPRSGRTEFFRRSSKQCLRHQSAAGRTDLTQLLVRLGARRTFRLLWSARGWGSRLRGTAGSVRGAVLRLYHSLQSRRRLDPALAVFLPSSSRRSQEYGGDLGALEERARALVPGLRTLWVAGDEAARSLPEGVSRVRPGSAAHWSALARAKYLLSDGDFGPRRHKRPGQVLVQTHTGTPLALAGLDRGERREDGAADLARLLEQVDEWDYSLSAGRHATLARERAYPGNYTALEYGSPRNDVFHRTTAEEVGRIRAELGVPAGAVAVLYDPVRRDYPHGGGSELELSRLASALGPGYVVLDARSPRPSAELCLAADVLVTDYSPIVFDYAVLDRPIVLYAPDWETYRATTGTYFDLLSAPPGPVAGDLEALVGCFRRNTWRSAGSHALRAAFRTRFCPYDDGLAAERVVRSVFLDGSALAPVVPTELRRPAPLPREEPARAVIHPARTGPGSAVGAPPQGART